MFLIDSSVYGWAFLFYYFFKIFDSVLTDFLDFFFIDVISVIE